MTTRKIVVNEKYSKLKGFVESLPSIFDKEGTVIRLARNDVKYFDVDGLRVNVKRYCSPRYLFNRVVYNFFRETKAERAYHYALQLLELGIDTPEPIAYIEECHNTLLLGHCYFVSIQVPHTRCYEEFSKSEVLDKDAEMILSAFGRFTAMVHQYGIYHRDYSAGNVLFEMVDGEPQFCLIDINRMNFGPLTKELCLKNFGRLASTPAVYRVIARAYSEAQGWEEEECFCGILKARAKFMGKQRLKPKRIFESLFQRS